MKIHVHVCRCCWKPYKCKGCTVPWAEYGVCPSCYSRDTFAEATPDWKGIGDAA